MSIEDVRKASDQFYAALNQMLNGDASALSGIWSHDDAVTTMHPIGGREVGWDEVRRSWEDVAAVASDGKVVLQDQRLQVGADMAYEIGVEHGTFALAGESVEAHARVTNVYRREASGWKIVHHHVDAAQQMVDIVERLKA